MSWLRIEGRMPQHHKVAPLSDAAFRLHITAMAWSVEGKTDGKIPLLIPQTLTRAPSGKKLRDILEELVRIGVWIEGPDSYQIHDFLEWNLSAAEIAARSEVKAKAGAVGGRRSGEARGKQEPSKGEAPASGLLQVAAKTSEANAKPQSQSLSQSLPRPNTPPEIPVVVGPPDSDGETRCPADLVGRADGAGIFLEMAAALGVSAEALRVEAQKFAGYWTIGAGAGKSRRNWLTKLRQRLLERVQDGTIAKSPPPSANREPTALQRSLQEAERREIAEMTAKAQAEFGDALSGLHSVSVAHLTRGVG